MQGRLIFSFSFIFLVTFLQAQHSITITGSVTDTAGAKLQGVVVTLLKNSTILAFASTEANGTYTLKANKSSLILSDIPLIIKFTSISYATVEKEIIVANEDIKLATAKMTPRPLYLSEISITTPPIIKKGDTTIFDVNAYKTKADANLEDLLLKMPGFDIDANGIIRYNNRSIADILIEGEPLTKNYKLISKNISPDMLSKIEMIDKYNENPVLAGFFESSTQVMNLKLKDGTKTKPFGSVNGGYGTNGRYKISNNLFAIRSKFKIMGFLIANNTGINPYSEVTTDEANAKDRSYAFTTTLSPAILAETPLFQHNSITRKTNTLFNQSKLGVINMNIRVSPLWTVKVYNDIYIDNSDRFTRRINRNLVNPGASFTEINNINIKPLYYNGSVEIKRLSKNAQLLLISTYNQKHFKESGQVVSALKSSSGLQSAFARVGLACFYTRRINNRHAYEIMIEALTDNKEQSIKLQSDSVRKVFAYNSNLFFQQASSIIQSAKVGFIFFSKRKELLSTLSAILTNTRIDYKSALSPEAFSTMPLLFTNDGVFITRNATVNYKRPFRITKKVSLVSSLGFFAAHNTLRYNAFSVILPILDLNMKARTGKYSSVSLSSSISNKLFDFLNIQPQPIISNYKSVNTNTFYNKQIPQMRFSLNFDHQNIDKGFFSSISINGALQNRTIVTNANFTSDFNYFNASPEGMASGYYGIYSKVDKYVGNLKTSFSFSNSINRLLNPYRVNNSVAANQIFMYISRLSVRPALIKNITLNIGADFTLTTDQLSKKSVWQVAPFTDITASLFKKTTLILNYKEFFSNLFIQDKNYTFLNFTLWQTIVPKKLEAKASLNNILNAKSIFTGSRFSFLENMQQERVLPRFLLLELSYKF